jgi:hypothetical protein
MIVGGKPARTWWYGEILIGSIPALRVMSGG